jgi:hypothetical protein
MPVITFTRTTTTVTTVTSFSIDVPTALPATGETAEPRANDLKQSVGCLPSKAIETPVRGSDRRTRSTPRSALAKLDAKELRQARAETRLAAIRQRENAESMARFAAGAVCFD